MGVKFIAFVLAAIVIQSNGRSIDETQFQMNKNTTNYAVKDAANVPVGGAIITSNNGNEDKIVLWGPEVRPGNEMMPKEGSLYIPRPTVGRPFSPQVLNAPNGGIIIRPLTPIKTFQPNAQVALEITPPPFLFSDDMESSQNQEVSSSV